MNRLLTSVKRFYNINISTSGNTSFTTSPGAIVYYDTNNNYTRLQIPPISTFSFKELVAPNDKSTVWISGNQQLRSAYPIGNYGATIQHNSLFQNLYVTINGLMGANLDFYANESL